MFKFITLILLITGCAHHQIQKGDLADFLLSQLQVHGAVLPADIRSPDIIASWQFHQDEDGFIINVESDVYPAVNRFLRELFGKPNIWADENSEGYPQGVFFKQQAGVTLQYCQTKVGLDIICIKDQKKAEPDA